MMRMAQRHPTTGWLNRLKNRYDYDPETGSVTWRHNTRTMRAGVPVGSKVRLPNGSYQLRLSGHPAAGVIWFLMTGYWPFRQQVETINNDPFDLRWSNLRLVERNVKGRSLPERTSPFRGVSWSNAQEKWIARCGPYLLGAYSNELDAAMAYDKKAIEIYGENARINVIQED